MMRKKHAHVPTVSKLIGDEQSTGKIIPILQHDLENPCVRPADEVPAECWIVRHMIYIITIVIASCAEHLD
jgi:hypothetical protein